ncbi:Two-component response regulator ARR18 [Platanthera zijinensis]|uniref:Two-component response regulator ARR18 n=1 Tax=Platanthera zijinensis TaxID=2320716 RepID=A0AAP0BFG7_9ASPA
MGSSSELTLDYKPNGYSMNPNQNPFGGEADKMQNLQEFLARLEEERLKIEAFKRELPLCMQLLNNAMEAYRRQLETYQTGREARPVIEEFIPLKSMPVEDVSEKASWMVSAQLWSRTADAVAAGPEKQEPGNAGAKESDQEQSPMPLSSKLVLDARPRGGGAFHPFSKVEQRMDLPQLALASIDKEMEEKESCSKSSGGEEQQCRGGINCSVSGDCTAPAAQRKARRCWSPDLHRRFVNALQRLGGSQSATPKQIRELMKVDGLTNDEVKSHLQKYRLHTRRPMPAPVPAPQVPPHLVVLGGIWVPQDYATSASMAAAAGPALYGTHHSSAQYCPTLPPPLSTAGAQLHYHLPSLIHAGGSKSTLSAYGGLRGSPESEFRSSGDRSESMEEEEEEEVVAGGVKAEDGDVAVKF